MSPLKILFAGLGLLFFAIGAVGALVPVLPTTPFLLLSAFFFAKSSKRINDWFVSSKLYKTHLEDFITERAMPLKTKVGLCSFASTMLIIAFILLDNIYARIFIVAVIAFKYYYFIFRIKTIKPSEGNKPALEKS